MTPPRAPGNADAARPHLALLAVPYALLFFTAAITPSSELIANQGDVGLYLQKAMAVASGLIPYRDVPLEYPPLALVPMVVPYLLWPFSVVTIDLYKWLFVGWEAALLVALALVLARVVSLGGHGDFIPARLGGGIGGGGERDVGTVPDAQQVRNTTIRLWILSVGAALVLAYRFDLFPALLTAVALWATLAGRPAIAGMSVGLGVLAKLYPIAIVPALAVPWLIRQDAKRLARFGGAAALTVAAGLLPFIAGAGSDALAFLSYQAQRGLQIESVAGGSILLDGLLRSQPAQINHDFGSVQVGGPSASAWLTALPALTVVSFGLLALLGWWRARAEVALHGAVAPGTVVLLATASILVLLVTSKVFSIQYIVWLVPFAALLPRRQFWLAAVMVGLTMPIHPGLYGKLVEQEALPILLLNLRNILLVALTVSVVADLRRGFVRAAPA